MNNYTNTEVEFLTNKVGNKGKVRVNKCGNLEVKFNNTKDDEWFVLYFTRNKKYLWRRHAVTYYGKCEYPLNMKRDKKTTIHSPYSGDYTYRPYCVDNSEFTTFNEAIDYFFNNYLVNFPMMKTMDGYLKDRC